jgi:hypothetical protein
VAVQDIRAINELVDDQPILTLICLLGFLPQRMAAGRPVGAWAAEGKENPPFLS